MSRLLLVDFEDHPSLSESDKFFLGYNVEQGFSILSHMMNLGPSEDVSEDFLTVTHTSLILGSLHLHSIKVDSVVVELSSLSRS